MIDLAQAQKEIFQNKLAHDFNTTNVEKEFCLLYGEVAEAFQAYKFESKANLGAELADVGIYLLGLSEILGIDLEQEIQQKMRRNAKRHYEKTPTGFHKEENEEAN